MQKIPARRASAGVALTLLLGLVAACDTPETVGVHEEAQLLSASDVQLLECPRGESRAASSGLLSILGGTISLGGNKVAAPQGAVTSRTEITLELPSTRYVQIELKANGQDHYQFLAPLLVTIDYSHCDGSLLNRSPLSVWLIDSETGELLRNMGGTDNRLLRQITFVTDHFSGYAIAN